MSLSRLIQDYPVTFAYGGICVIVIVLLNVFSAVWGW